MDYNIYRNLPYGGNVMPYMNEQTQMIKPLAPTYSLDSALPYGEMPDEALAAKFEETQYYNDSEDVYDNYARRNLKDWSPDPVSLESDFPRRNYEAAGVLNIRYNGGRGKENMPSHPEAFLELTEREPRGVNTDPDMRKMVQQQGARMRFIRFGADADNSVPEGVWSESEAFYKSRILTQQMIQPRLKVFSTSKDGRREGLRRDYYPHKSVVNKIEEDINAFRPQSSTFTDYITDYALNPQRKTVFLSNDITRRTRLYNSFLPDHEFKVARYGENPRKRRLTGKVGSHIGDVEYEDYTGGATEENILNEDSNPVMKSAGILMGAIVKQRTETHNDTDYGASADSQADRKTAALKRDLTIILRETDQDASFSASNHSITVKTANPQQSDHLARVQEANHIRPAHHDLNAEIMYKSVQPGADTEALKHEILRDNRDIPNREVFSLFGKSNTRQIRGSRDKRETFVEVDGKSLQPFNYKSVTKQVKHPGKNGFHGEGFAQASRNSQIRQNNHGGYRVTTPRDVIGDNGIHTLGNLSGERHIGPMGDKSAVRRHLLRDTELNEIAAMS